MNLVQSTTARRGALIAGLALAALLTAGAPLAHGQYLEVGPSGLTLLPDSGGSESYRVDLFDDAGWSGNELRLVSFLGGELWSVDTPLDLSFTGIGSTLAAFGAGAVIDASLDFTSAGFLVPGPWEAGATLFLGFHREVEGEDYYGALAFRYDQDNSLLLSRFGIAPGAFNTSVLTSLDPIPEPATAALPVVALAVLGAIVRRRRRRPAVMAAD